MSSGKQNLSNPNVGWKYATPAVLLHWVLATLIMGLLGIGWYMMSIEDTPGSDWYFNVHKSFGTVVFGLVLLRVLWRATHRPGALPAGLPKWQVRLSGLTQGALYVCMLLMPVLGFVGALFSKNGIVFFGMPLASWTGPNLDTAELLFELHSTLPVSTGPRASSDTACFPICRTKRFRRRWACLPRRH